MFKLISAAYFKFSDGPDICIPLFMKGRNNNLYVCETDEYFHIVNFYAITDLSEYLTVDLNTDSTFSVGDQMPITIRSRDGVGSVASYQYCLDNYKDITAGASNIFCYDLGVIIGVEKGIQLEFLKRISEDHLSSERIRSCWFGIELTTLNSSAFFWKNFHEKNKSQLELAQEISGSSNIHDVLRWLMKKSSISNEGWPTVWRIARETMPHERLVYGAAVRWVSEFYTLFEPKDALENLNFIEVLLSIVEDGEELDQVDDILTEIFTDDPNSISLFLNSLSSYRNLRRTLVDVQSWEAVGWLDRLAQLKGYHR